MNKKQVSVLCMCVHNSARSQMAETFFNALGEGKFSAESAGLEPGKLNPLVVKVMKEEGYDLSENITNSVFDLYAQGKSYDLVIAVCSREAQERCPIFPGNGTRIHWPFDDPSSLTGTEGECLDQTRRIRDEIKSKVKDFISSYKVQIN